MGTTRVWNVTSHPDTDVPSQNLTVLGKVLKPGDSVEIDEADLETAHKLKAYVKAGLLAVSKSAPSFMAAAHKVILANSVNRNHGEAAVAPAKVEARPVKVEEKKVDKHKR